MIGNQKKKAEAVVLGLMVCLTGSALTTPAEAASSEDIDARIAAIEQQQQDLAAQLDKLKKENAELKETKEIAKNNSDAIKSIKDVADRVQFFGMGRISYDHDNYRHYQDENRNSRFYLDLHANFKVNDRWKVGFQSETNPRWKSQVTMDSKGGKDKNGHHRFEQWGGTRDKEWGTIQRVWAEGSVGKVNMDVGRRWRGIGFQNIFVGHETDGITAETAIPGTKLNGELFWLAPTDNGNDFNLYGGAVKGQIGHGLQIQAAYAQLNKGRNDYVGKDYYGAPLYKVTDNGTIDRNWDANGVDNWVGRHATLLSAMWNPMKNVSLIGDWVHTDRNHGHYGYDSKNTYAVRLNYRQTDLNNPGTYQLYTRWFAYPDGGNVGMIGDDEWGSHAPGLKGWTLGFKYVPGKNIEWETFGQWAVDRNGGDRYIRHLVRTQMDYHF